jgi:hypothetical protein
MRAQVRVEYGECMKAADYWLAILGKPPSVRLQ